MPSNGICHGFAFQYGKFLLPPRFLTALSVPKVPTREQLLSLSHISIKIAFSYSCHDADTIFPVSFIFTASSFRAPCLFLLDRNGPNVSSRSRHTIYIQTKPPECSSLFYIIPTRSPRLSHKKTIFCNENSKFYKFSLLFPALPSPLPGSPDFLCHMPDTASGTQSSRTNIQSYIFV